MKHTVAVVKVSVVLVLASFVLIQVAAWFGGYWIFPDMDFASVWHASLSLILIGVYAWVIKDILSRKRSGYLAVVAFSAIELWFLFGTFVEGDDNPTNFIEVLIAACWLTSAGLLSSPQGRRWFKGESNGVR